MSTPAPPGSYPGNASLPAEVREKILSTFRHTLSMYSAGKYNDCLIGCEFILKMDPRFAPARRLLEKARNPNAAIDIAELEASIAPGAAAPPNEAGKAEADRLLREAAASYEGRDFDTAISRVKEILAAQPTHPDAMVLLGKAEGKKSAQPLFDVIHMRADAALQDLRPDDARKELERMRQLDAEHPAIPLIQSRIAAAAAPAAAPTDSWRPEGGVPPDEPSARRTGEAPVDSAPALVSGFGAVVGGAPAPAPERPAGEPEAFSSSFGEEFVGATGAEPGFPMDSYSPDPLPASFARPDVPGADDEAGEREIAALLQRGDDTERSGDRQQAIEIWSRIFLIDINNSEAVKRIEKARQEMAEENRRVAEYLKKGREAFEAGDRDAARDIFQQALAIDPAEQTARFYLERIEEGLAAASSPPASESSAPETARAEPPARVSPRPMPAAPSVAAAPARAPSRRAGISLPSPRVLAVVGALLVMAIGGAYFLFRSGPGKAAPPAAKQETESPLDRARELLGEGKIAQARMQLRRVPRDQPEYAEAQKMLAELGSENAGPAGAPPAGAPSGSQAAPSAERAPDRMRAAAEKALSEHRYIEAFKDFNLAAPAFRNDPTFSQGMSAAAEKVTAMTPAVKLYNEGEFETAIPILWRIYQEDHENQDARSYLFRAYFNQGISQLQNGLSAKAVQSFQEALTLEPNDGEAARHRKFAETHQKGGDFDLMGRIYVRHLRQRP